MTAMTEKKQTTMSQAEFARHRGVSRATVTEYKNKGLLVMTVDNLVDVAASKKSLNDHLDPLRGGARSGGNKKPSADSKAYMAAKTREMEAKAVKQEMETRQRAGELLEKDDVYKTAFTLARNAQESIMATADRLSPLLAAESDAAAVHAMLSDELRLVCQNIAKTARESLE